MLRIEHVPVSKNARPLKAIKTVDYFVFSVGKSDHSKYSDARVADMQKSSLLCTSLNPQITSRSFIRGEGYEWPTHIWVTLTSIPGRNKT